VIVVKVLAEFVRQKHDDTDDVFLVLSGRLTIQLRDRDIELDQAEMFVVARGVEQLPEGRRGGACPLDRGAGYGQHGRRRW
jgi:mannose-6-phosphate isomerase-like protein (cupin superfamily)